MTRTPMGPPASEPEQRDYAITITAPDGMTTSAGIVRSHHALDAAREAAETRGFQWRASGEHSHPDGSWAVACVDGHTVQAAVDSPQTREGQLRRAAHDERAATQRRIADAIRKHDVGDGAMVSARIIRGEIASTERERCVVFQTLAACAKYPEILDAVNQVATLHRLEEW